ncbi:MAG: ferrichrome-iron receptor [Nitrospirales bacterium]|nr:MAG: ferrichrome-iron receptor [Nitrospirales bacterium]
MRDRRTGPRHTMQTQRSGAERPSTIRQTAQRVIARERTGVYPHRQRLTWNFIVGLSSLALTAYSPALAEDAWDIRKDTAKARDASPRMVADQDSLNAPALSVDIQPGDLHPALLTLGRQTNLQLLYPPALITGRQTHGVQGKMTPEHALKAVLDGTGLIYRFSDADTVTLFAQDDTGAVGAAGAAAVAGAAIESEVPVIEVQPVEVTDTIKRNKVFLPPVDGYKADETTGSTRTALPITETPTSIGVVTRDVIKDTYSLRQGDALEHVSGVSRSSSRMGRAEGVNIRGFFVGDFANAFSSLRQNGLATDGAFAPDPALIERYEIIKGPVSISGGASSPGGLVNRITKTPQAANFATSEFQAGSFGLSRGVVDANGVLPLTPNVRGRLIFAVEEGGNFVDDVDVRQYTVAPSLEIDLFDGAGTLLLTGQYQKFDGSSYLGFPLLVNGKVPDIPRTRNIGGGTKTGADLTFEGQNYEMHYLHEFVDNLTLSIKGKYGHSDVRDKSVYAYDVVGFDGIQLNGDARITDTLRINDIETYAGEIFVSKEFEAFGQSHEVLIGADHRDMNQDFFNAFSYTELGIDNVFNPANNFQISSDADLLARGGGFNPRTVDLIQTGLFGQVVVRPLAPLTLVAAGRYDWADLTNKDVRTNETRNGEFSHFTGRVGATYEIVSGLHVYAGYAQSFQVTPFRRTLDGVLVEPETGDSYEVGAKLDLLDGKLLLSTAVFRAYRENVAAFDPNNPGFSLTVGEQRHQGIEFDVNGQPVPGLNLTANVSYIDAEITKDTNANLKGSVPTRVPRSYVGRVFGTYEWQSGMLQGFGVGGGVFFHSGFELTAPNRFGTDPYQRVDAVVFYRPPQKAYDFTINVRNLLDKTYIESPGGLAAYNQFGAPVSVFGTLRVKFDPDLEWTPPWAD